MNDNEIRILKEAISRPEGLLSPAILINSIAKRDKGAVEKLVVLGYLERVSQCMPSLAGTYTIDFFRVTKRGYLLFAPLFKKIWFNIKSDFRTIVVAIITTIIMSLLSLLFK